MQRATSSHPRLNTGDEASQQIHGSSGAEDTSFAYASTSLTDHPPGTTKALLYTYSQVESSLLSRDSSRTLNSVTGIPFSRARAIVNAVPRDSPSQNANT